MTSFSYIASVVVDVNLNQLLDYGIPEPFLNQVALGMQVKVPLSSRLVTGFIVKIYKNNSKERPLPLTTSLTESHLTPKSRTFKLKPIHEVLSQTPLLSAQLIPLAIWMADYYLSPLYKVIKNMIPASIRKNSSPKLQWTVKRAKSKETLKLLCQKLRITAPKQAEVLDVLLTVDKAIFLTELLEKTKTSRAPVETLAKQGALVLERVILDRSPLIGEEYIQTKPKPLNNEQKCAFEKIQQSLEAKQFKTHLLYGVTGSGKTEIYLQAIEKVLEKGQGVIVLVPEIALTAQTIERFKSRFQEKIAAFHHRLSDGERLDIWNNIASGLVRIVIGARSCVFSPVKNLGLIIVDEEHEPSYKQTEEMPSYHARDVAVMRGKLEAIPVILGSATPSLESYLNAMEGKYLLNTLSCRAQNTALPVVTFVDMNQEFKKAKGFTNFSDALISALKKRIEKGEQSILFLNRRGYHTSLYCPCCKTKVECNHCAVSLTFHKKGNYLSCHLCGYQITPPPTSCPKCHLAEPMKYQGVGTEQIEKQLLSLFPQIRLLRMDADTTKHKGSHQALYRSFATGKADVLIGTQMVAKGLHFPQVTLVGILNSDASLHIPDFRASEHTFQMITQVAGRAGRGNFPGEVIIQTQLPDNKTLHLAAKQDFKDFYEEEIEIRKIFNYPPLTQMIKLTFSGKDEKKVFSISESILKHLLFFLPAQVETHPIIPCGHVKVKDTYRFQTLLKFPKQIGAKVRGALKQGLGKAPLPSFVKVHVDINPLSTY